MCLASCKKCFYHEGDVRLSYDTINIGQNGYIPTRIYKLFLPVYVSLHTGKPNFFYIRHERIY